MFSLKHVNAFAIDVFADKINTVFSEYELLIRWRESVKNGKSALLIGGGYNILFLENFNGTILLNRIKGIFVKEDLENWYLHVGAGEIWHKLVVYSLCNNIHGLENLAFIPGYVGAAPIHNIGAFGVDLQKFCEYVDVVYLDSGRKIRFDINECEFGYRDSIFRSKMNNIQYAIVAVGLKISKNWRPVLNYNTLCSLDVDEITPYKLFHFICKIRYRKLPNLYSVGHAGSFFKNPIVNIDIVNVLLKNYPNMPFYLQINGKVKLYAGWLIDHCCLRGYKLGNAAVYNKHSLILINYTKRATGFEIFNLACIVRNKVAEKFSIWLEPEVRFITSFGEVDGVYLFTSNKF